MKIDPKNLISLHSKGAALFNLGRLNESIEYYDKVLNIDSKDLDSLYSKGNALFKLER